MIGTWQQLGAMRYALLRVWSEYRDSLHGEVLWTGDTGAMWVVCRTRSPASSAAIASTKESQPP